MKEEISCWRDLRQINVPETYTRIGLKHFAGLLIVVPAMNTEGDRQLVLPSGREENYRFWERQYHLEIIIATILRSFPCAKKFLKRENICRRSARWELQRKFASSALYVQIPSSQSYPTF
jgi:hypothetical protein